MINKPFIYLIKFYQFFISPMLGNNCRFNPSCSQYSIECFNHYHMPKAFWFSLVRVSKCHPFHKGGNDPIPHFKSRGK